MGREVGGLCTRYIVFSYVNFYNQSSLKQEATKLHSKQWKVFIKGIYRMNIKGYEHYDTNIKIEGERNNRIK